MACARLNNISVAYGERDILCEVTLTIDRTSRIALAGDNGSGKTTLLRIAAGLSEPDSGSVQLQHDTIVSYLPQSGLAFSRSSLFEEADRAFARFHTLERRKTEIENSLGEVDSMDGDVAALLHEHDELQEALVHSGFYDREPVIHRVLLGLGFSESDFDRKTEEFSGGWQMRIGLAKVLLADPDIVLLDEPTNYLDIEARTWLEEFLAGFDGGVVVVSHDRYFLDVTVTQVAELLRSRLTLYAGNYSEYERRRTEELESLYADYKQQQREIERLEAFIRRFRAKPTKAAQVQSRIKQLEKMELIEISESMKRIAFSFPEAPHSGRIVLRVEQLSKSYGSHQVLHDVEFVLERGERMVIAGKNGAGKSTLMRILSGADDEYTGSLRLGAGVRIGYFSQELDSLPTSGTVLEAVEDVADTSDVPRLRDLLGAFLFRGDDVFKSVSVLSGGERSRLALLLLLLHPVNLLILDEPTNHLDMTSKRVLLDALQNFGGTLVFVSHDRYFIEALADRVLELKDGRWALFPGDYRYYLRRTGGSSEQALDARAYGEPLDSGTSASQTAPSQPLAPQSCTSHPASSGPAAPHPRGTRRSAGGGTSTTPNNDPSQHALAPLDRDEEKALRKRLRRLEQNESETMETIEALDRKHSECQAELAKEENYAVGDRVKALTEELRLVEAQRDTLTASWGEISEEAEGIRRRLESSGRAL